MVVTGDEILGVPLPSAGKELVVSWVLCDEVNRERPFRYHTLGIEEGNEGVDLLIRPAVVLSDLLAGENFPDLGQNLQRSHAGEPSFLQEGTYCAVHKIDDTSPRTAQSGGRVRGGAAARPSR